MNDMDELGRRKIDSPEARESLLKDLAEGYTLTEAALRIGVTTSVVDQWRREDQKFDVECRTAYQDSTEVLEKEARARALDRQDSQSAGLLKFLIAGRHTRWGLAAKEMPEPKLAFRPMPDTAEVARRITYLLDEGARKVALQKQAEKSASE